MQIALFRQCQCVRGAISSALQTSLKCFLCLVFCILILAQSPFPVKFGARCACRQVCNSHQVKFHTTAWGTAKWNLGCKQRRCSGNAELCCWEGNLMEWCCFLFISDKHISNLELVYLGCHGGFISLLQSEAPARRIGEKEKKRERDLEWEQRKPIFSTTCTTRLWWLFSEGNWTRLKAHFYSQKTEVGQTGEVRTLQWRGKKKHKGCLSSQERQGERRCRLESPIRRAGPLVGELQGIEGSNYEHRRLNLDYQNKHEVGTLTTHLIQAWKNCGFQWIGFFYLILCFCFRKGWLSTCLECNLTWQSGKISVTFCRFILLSSSLDAQKYLFFLFGFLSNLILNVTCSSVFLGFRSILS